LYVQDNAISVPKRQALKAFEEVQVKLPLSYHRHYTDVSDKILIPSAFLDKEL
jgi:hypothetical protein